VTGACSMNVPGGSSSRMVQVMVSPSFFVSCVLELEVVQLGGRKDVGSIRDAFPEGAAFFLCSRLEVGRASTGE
jgi:hypothetical protein